MAARLQRIGIALLLVVALMTVAPVQHLRAANTQYVFSIADGPSTATDCTQSLSGCSLRDALHAAASGDTVALAPGIVQPFTVLLTAGPLIIGQSVTIQGQGLLTVDGQQASRVFAITAGTVEMDGVTITHGQASDQGAGINQTGGSLTLVNCVVTDNTASGTGRVVGGGIYALGTLTLTNTTVSRKMVGDTGNTTADSAFGGGIAQGGGTLTVTVSTISGNVVQMNAPNANAQMGVAASSSTSMARCT